MRLSRMLVANGLLLIGAVMENPNNKVVPFYFMTLAAMLAFDEFKREWK